MQDKFPYRTVTKIALPASSFGVSKLVMVVQEILCSLFLLAAPESYSEQEVLATRTKQPRVSRSSISFGITLTRLSNDCDRVF